MFSKEETFVLRLGNCSIPSPLRLSKQLGDGVFDYVQDEERILYDLSLQNYKNSIGQALEPVSFEKSGPKEYIYFDPSKTKAAIVTCGGLCPGLNNVIRGLVMQLSKRYGVNRIVGIKYGYEGFIPKYQHEVIDLDTEKVEDIHMQGGSILGTSRGHQEPSEIVDALEKMNINLLFTIGGDGTLHGTQAITDEITKRGLKIAVAGIPKTIDNDINLIEKSFGFETAFTVASDIIRGAHNEAKGAYNGIAIVKLMGRDSGFITANATLASQEVNFAIIPELKFELDGPKGFLNILQKRLERKHHALIVVAEGAGQNLFNNNVVENDTSGNVKYNDIGLFIKDAISKEFKRTGFAHTIKYIDPSYIIRSAHANANDSLFCNLLAQNAVHGAMAGRTGFVVGYWNSQFVLLPIPLTIKDRKRISIESELWSNVIETTGQPISFTN